MEYRSLGRCGLKVSSLCLGAMTFGESQGFMKGVTSSDAESRRVLDVAFERGVNLVDTADVYSEGRSEKLLGDWLVGKRDRVLVATKCRMPMGPGPNDLGLSRKHVVEACEASLERLQTDFIDLYQVHMQDRSTPVEETMRALDDLVTAGKVRYAGCSNYAGYRLAEALWASDKRNLVRYESIQLQWSLVSRDCERELVPAARHFGLGVLVWSPLARGFLSGKYAQGRPPPPGSRLETWQDSWRMYEHDARAWQVLDAVRAMAREKNTTPATVALAWLLTRPEVSSLVVGARTVPQLEENLAAAELELTADERKRLDAVSEPAWGYPYEFIGRREPW